MPAGKKSGSMVGNETSADMAGAFSSFKGNKPSLGEAKEKGTRTDVPKPKSPSAHGMSPREKK